MMNRSTWYAAGLLAFAVAVGGVYWLVHGLGQAGPGRGVIAPAPNPANRLDSSAMLQHEVESIRAPDGSDAAAGDATPAIADAEPAEVADGLVLTILHADGTAAAGATTVTAHGSTVLAVASIGDDGIARLPAADGEVDVWVGGATLAPARIPLKESSGAHRIVLPRGDVVSGFVLLEGVAPAMPIGLALGGRSEDATRAPIPGNVAQALATIDTGFGGTVIGQLTTSAGQFHFSDLPTDWSGSISFPFQYRLQDGGDYAVYLADHPGRGHEIRLVLRRAITGRVVTADGRPVPDAVIEEYVDHYGHSWTKTSHADGKAYFRVPLRDEPLRVVDLSISAPDQSGRRVLRLEGEEWPTGLDLGDVELTAVRAIPFVTRDVQGNPVAGAVAIATDGSGATSEPTDSTGNATLAGLKVDTTAMQVSALGFMDAEVTLSESLDGPLEVTLTRAASLELRLHSADGRPAAWLSATISSKQPLFAGVDSWGPDARQVDFGAAALRSAEVGIDEGRIRVDVDKNGRCLLTQLRAPLTLDVIVSDGNGFVVRPHETVAVAADEARILDWTVLGTPRDVLVHVHDDAGMPIERALVHAVTEGSENLGISGGSTDVAGNARLPSVYTDHISIQVSKDGYARGWIGDALVPADERPLDVLLERGATLLVHVVDTDGTAKDAQHVTIDGIGTPIEATHVGTGLYEAPDLPLGNVRATAHLAQRRYSVATSTSAAEASIVLPGLGSLVAHVAGPLDPSRYYQILVSDSAAMPWAGKWWLSQADARSSQPSLTITDVMAGDYDVHLQLMTGIDGNGVDCAAPIHVTVPAGEIVTCTFEG